MELKPQIRYSSGYKYQLVDTYTHALSQPWNVDNTDGNLFVTIRTDSVLVIRGGYAWDGASGPTVDTKSTMRASLVHDALYQLIREGYLQSTDEVYDLADAELRAVMVEDSRAEGILGWLRNWWGSARAWYYERAVNRFGKSKNKPKPVEVAP